MAIRVHIRRNVFETNSSSVHSVSYQPQNAVTIMDLKQVAKTLVTKDGTVIGRFGEFGRGYDVLSSFDEKLSYVLTEMANYAADEDEIRSMKEFQWLDSLFQEKLGASLQLAYNDDDSYPFGYVDHQSVGALKEQNMWGYDEEEFKMNIFNFLFDDSYTMIISSDG